MARPKAENPLVGVQGRVYQRDLEYLDLWSKEQGMALREIIERCRKMWPAGPFTAGGGTKRPSRPIITAKLKAYAEKQGVSPKEAAARIVAEFLRAESAGRHDDAGLAKTQPEQGRQEA